MRNQILLSFLCLFLLISCEKKEEKDTTPKVTTNIDEIINTLDSTEFITISPQPDDTIELNQTFELQTLTKNVEYIETYETGEKSTMKIDVEIYIYNIEILDLNNIAYTYTKTETDTGQYALEVTDILYPDSEFKVVIQYVYKHSSEHALSINGIKREKIYHYNTSKYPNLFPYMVYCQYPLERQYNYLQDEYPYGFIKTKEKPDYMLNKNLVALITNIKTGEFFSKTISYDDELGILKYEMPELSNNTIYKIEFLSGGKNEFYTTNYFKTSKYDKFSDKIGSVFEGEKEGVLWSNSVYYSVTYNNYNEIKDEPMDYYERISSPPGTLSVNNILNQLDYPKLVTVEIDTQKTDLNVFGYDYAQQLGFEIDRETDYVGFKPVKDFFYIFHMGKGDIKLSDSEISNKKPNTSGEYYYSMKNYWSWIFSEDIRDFYLQAMNSNSNSSLVDSILDLKYHFNLDVKMKYYYKMHYKIPGINKIVFTGEYEIGP